MVKIAVLGDTESIKGFAAVGLEIFPCDEESEAPRIFKEIVASGYGVIYVTEYLAALLHKEISRLDTSLTPSVVSIPGIKGNNSIGTALLRDSVIKAVGSDIVFNKE